MGWLHFLNLQYWYCVIYSTFGGKCAYLEELRKANGGTTGTNVDKQSVVEVILNTLSSIWHSIWEVASGIISFVWGVYSAIAWTISGILFFTILSALLGFLFIRFRELYTYGTLPAGVVEDDPNKNRWEELLEYAKSTDPKLWKRAILEADQMLGDLLGRLGYQGVNTAEKMKMLPEDAFVTVPVAWEAHRVRNFVSSGSSDFILTQREAFRVMKLYEQVFEEFNFI